MHIYVYFWFFLGQQWSKGKLCKIVTLNHYNWILYKHTCSFLCYDCNTQTESKSEDENKTKTLFYIYLASLSDENKQTRKQKAHIISMV